MTLDDIKDNCRIEEGHWIWAGGLSGGLPTIHAPDYTRSDGRKQTQRGRRAVWHIKHKRAIPAGWRVFGNCEEALCVNPAHIECITEIEYGARVAASDKQKGRVQRIVANRAIGRKRSKVNPETIAYIRSSRKTGIALAGELNISPQTISKYRTGTAPTSFDHIGGLFTGLLMAGKATTAANARAL
ncbi:MAG: hypothetical protein V4669_13790 [Pseudomonadota bacterium]